MFVTIKNPNHNRLVGFLDKLRDFLSLDGFDKFHVLSQQLWGMIPIRAIKEKNF